jgi:hypothetical protein
MSRRHIHYWKCDRPEAFFATAKRPTTSAAWLPELQRTLQRQFDQSDLQLRPGPGEGNHLTLLAQGGDFEGFVRVETGPESDPHLEVESAILQAVAEIGVRTPRVLACDASRRELPVAWQVLERIQAPALSHWSAKGCLNLDSVAWQIGLAVGKWQVLKWPGFGIIEQGLLGGHHQYEDHFFLRLEDHLQILQRGGLMQAAEVKELRQLLEQHRSLLRLEQGCLVHKDLALWNVLGQPSSAEVFIDFDDAMMGDAMDDFSLLACFHNAATLRKALQAAQTIRPHPADSMRRFWLHLLRNVIIKTVIRQGSGYFTGNAPAFLGGAAAAGALRQQSLRLLRLATAGLREDLPIEHLDAP